MDGGSNRHRDSRALAWSRPPGLAQLPRSLLTMPPFNLSHSPSGPSSIHLPDPADVQPAYPMAGFAYDPSASYAPEEYQHFLPPAPSLHALPVDRSKTEPKPAFYKLQFGDDVTGFSYYVRTMEVMIGRNAVSASARVAAGQS